MTFFDKLDLTIVIALFAASFWFGGSKWRWHVTVLFLAVHLVAARYFIHVFDNPIHALALLHTGLALLLLAYSETNFGRTVGLCFFLMLALDGLAIAGILSPEIRLGLRMNFWNYLSVLQHVQALTLFVCFWQNRRSAWAMV